MSTSEPIFQRAVVNMLREIFDGPPAGEPSFVLNRGDPGLLQDLDRIGAEAASTRPMPGKTTIAAHVDHVCYGLSLLNRWASGEANAWEGADWQASWKRGQVTDAQWRTLRAALRRESEAWRSHTAQLTTWDDLSAACALSSVAHTAYHFGAIRQILAGLEK